MYKIKAPDGTNNLCGKRLAEIRKQRNLSQRSLAKKLQLKGYDVDHYYIMRIENGERFVTDIDLKILCEVLDVPLSDLFTV